MQKHLTRIIESREFVALDSAFTELAEATTFGKVQRLRDMGEVARELAKKAHLGLEVQNRAAELKLRAERKAGEFLANLSLKGGDRKSKGHRAPLILEDLGITRDQSKRWQKEAVVPEDEFEAYIRQAQTDEVEISSAALLRLAKNNRPSKPSSSHNSPNGTAKNNNACIEVILESEPQQKLPKLDELQIEIEELKGHSQSVSNLIEQNESTVHGELNDDKKMQLLRHYLTEIDKSFHRIDSIFLKSHNTLDQ